MMSDTLLKKRFSQKELVFQYYLDNPNLEVFKKYHINGHIEWEE